MISVLITGIHGMDGRLLAEFYHHQGARIIGWGRSGTDAPTVPGVAAMVEGHLDDERAVLAAIRTYRPDVTFHLAAVHHSSQAGQDDPVALSAAMWRVNCLAVTHFIQALAHEYPVGRLVCAGSSQMYQAAPNTDVTIIDEDTPIRPRTPYAVGKAAALTAIQFARQQYGLGAAMGMLFNHESPLRGPSFVTRKITMAAAKAARGQPVRLELMNIGARVDWSDARDIVAGLALMAGAAHMDDYVLGSGRLYTIRDVLEMAFAPLGLDWRAYVVAAEDRAEPAFVARPQRVMAALGWQPTADMAPVIAAMVAADMQQA